jgi:hypothetical protein
MSWRDASASPAMMKRPLAVSDDQADDLQRKPISLAVVLSPCKTQGLVT